MRFPPNPTITLKKADGIITYIRSHNPGSAVRHAAAFDMTPDEMRRFIERNREMWSPQEAA